MELSEFIKVRGENYENLNNQELESSNAFGYIEIALENISGIFVNDMMSGIPIDWTEVRKNLGGMMTGIVNFCQANSIDLRQVLDMNIQHLKEKKPQGDLMILHKEDIIFSKKPFNSE